MGIVGDFVKVRVCRKWKQLCKHMFLYVPFLNSAKNIFVHGFIAPLSLGSRWRSTKTQDFRTSIGSILWGLCLPRSLHFQCGAAGRQRLRWSDLCAAPADFGQRRHGRRVALGAGARSLRKATRRCEADLVHDVSWLLNGFWLVDVYGCLWMFMDGYGCWCLCCNFWHLFLFFFGEAKLEMFTQDQYILRDKIATSYSGNPPLTFL